MQSWAFSFPHEIILKWDEFHWHRLVPRPTALARDNEGRMLQSVVKATAMESRVTVNPSPSARTAKTISCPHLSSTYGKQAVC